MGALLTLIVWASREERPLSPPGSSPAAQASENY